MAWLPSLVQNPPAEDETEAEETEAEETEAEETEAEETEAEETEVEGEAEETEAEETEAEETEAEMPTTQMFEITLTNLTEGVHGESGQTLSPAIFAAHPCGCENCRSRSTCK